MLLLFILFRSFSMPTVFMYTSLSRVISVLLYARCFSVNVFMRTNCHVSFTVVLRLHHSAQHILLYQASSVIHSTVWRCRLVKHYFFMCPRWKPNAVSGDHAFAESPLAAVAQCVHACRPGGPNFDFNLLTV